MTRHVTQFVARRRTALVIAVTLVVLAISASALALNVRESADSPSLRWGSGEVPGNVMIIDAAVREAATRSDVTPASVRELAATATGYRLLVGRRADGRLCTAQRSPTLVGGFNCVSTWSDRFAMLLYSIEGGPDVHTTTQREIVGIARDDVARVVVTTAAGAINDLHLTAGRGFAYSSDVPDGLPIAITAYDGQGRVLQTEEMALSPPDR